MATSSRTDTLGVRLTPQERRTLEQAARVMRTTPSEIARTAALEVARQALRIIARQDADDRAR